MISKMPSSPKLFRVNTFTSVILLPSNILVHRTIMDYNYIPRARSTTRSEKCSFRNRTLVARIKSRPFNHVKVRHYVKAIIFVWHCEIIVPR